MRDWIRDLNLWYLALSPKISKNHAQTLTPPPIALGEEESGIRKATLPAVIFNRLLALHNNGLFPFSSTRL